MDASQQITELLARWRNGDQQARDTLFNLIYKQLSDLAHRQRLRSPGNHTIDTVALVGEVYQKLARQPELQARDRGHFFTLAAKAMRQILVDYARGKKRQKRGGDWQQVSLNTGEEPADQLVQQIEEILDLNDALAKLADYNERYVNVVELSYFGGLSYDEIAEALAVTKRTVTRDMAKAIPLLRQLLRNPATGELSQDDS